MQIDNVDFITWIANGYNPYTGEKFSDNDILTSTEVSVRLKELAEELSKDRIEERINRRNTVKIFYPYTSIQPFAKEISYAIYNAQKYGTIQSKIINFLLDDNKIEFRYPSSRSEKMEKFATKEGNLIGITDKYYTFENKKEHMLCYYPDAQIYILKNLSKILKWD